MTDTTIIDDENNYGYVPTVYVCIIFLTLFALSTTCHLGQGIYYRSWFTIPTLFLGGFAESIGWAGRTWSSQAPTARNPYLIQIVSTIIAPTFMSAANFIILGRIIGTENQKYSLLQGKLYSRIFLSIDLLALVVQSVGGGMAASGDTKEDTDKGGKIALAGVIIQLVALFFYAGLTADFSYRLLKGKPYPSKSASSYTAVDEKQTSRLSYWNKLMLLGLLTSTGLLVIRGIYRTIELNDGWNGKIISTQLYFNLFDGTPIILSMITMNLLHPGRLLRDLLSVTSEESVELAAPLRHSGQR